MFYDCLEPAAREIAIASSKPPFPYQLSIKEARQKLEEMQSNPTFLFPAKEQKVFIHTSTFHQLLVYCVSPEQICEKPSVIFYIHGGGWVLGSFHTHRKLVHELAHETNSIVVFPEYSRSPEAKYPTALEECYAALCKLPEILYSCELEANLNSLMIGGDSVGGNMATVLALLSKYRNGPNIKKQFLFYPVTNACFDTPSYREFANGYYLSRNTMMWFWNQYTSCKHERFEITASPLRATITQLSDLPPTLIINGDSDVLKSEGFAYADHLRRAGVDVASVCIRGMIHDFVMLNDLDASLGCRMAMSCVKDFCTAVTV